MGAQFPGGASTTADAPGRGLAGLAARAGGAWQLAVLAAILALGLGLRLDYAITPGNAPVYDARAYEGIAAGLHRSDRFEQIPTAEQPVTQPATNYSPGLPLLVGGIYELSGGVHLRLARIVLALIGALAPLFAYLLAARWAGPAAGLVAAVPVAIYPALLEYQGMLMPEPLAATLLAGAVLTFLSASDRVSLPRFALAGLLFGATALVRPEYLIAGVAAGLLAAIRAARIGAARGGLLTAGALLAGLVVVVAPWTLRNALALERFVPISTGGGQVLYAGNYLPSEGNPQRVAAELLERRPELRADLPRREGRAGEPPYYLEEVLAALAARRHPELSTDVALSRMGRELLGENVTERPGEYAGFLLDKLDRIWTEGPREIMERPVWRVLHLAVVLAGLAGLVLLAARGGWDASLLALLLALSTLAGMVFVASPRRTLVFLPLLAALAGAAAIWAADAIRERRRGA